MVRLSLLAWLALLALGCQESSNIYPAVPVLDDYPALSTDDRLVLTGRCDNAESVVASRSDGTLFVGTGGARFTVELLLEIDELNRFEIYGTRGDLRGRGAEVSIYRIAEEEPIPPPEDILPPEPPVLDQAESPTEALHPLLTGTAEAGSTIEVTGGAMGSSGDTDPITGRFAMQLHLVRRRVNHLAVVAVDPAGNVSLPALLVVEHQELTPPQPTGSLPPPELEPLPSTTTRLCLTVSGSTRPDAEVHVAGGEAQGVARSDSSGHFDVGVALMVGEVNHLEVHAVAQDGEETMRALAEVAQNLPASELRTRYPILLAHGMCGFDRIGPVEYYLGVQEHMESSGFEVYTSEVAPLDSSYRRAGQLRDFILRTTSGKVNIIAHSQGGLDSRYLVAALGMADHVASITTVSTPHRGSHLADLVLGLAGDRGQALAQRVLGVIGMDIEGMREVTVEGMASFNEKFLDHPDVIYWSWGFDARAEGYSMWAPLFPIWAIIEAVEGTNDSLVSTASASWGEYLGTPGADHWSEVGQPLGRTSSFDHLEFFLQEALRLEEMGL